MQHRVAREFALAREGLEIALGRPLAEPHGVRLPGKRAKGLGDGSEVDDAEPRSVGHGIGATDGVELFEQ
jgi:hypothetical protein